MESRTKCRVKGAGHDQEGGASVNEAEGLRGERAAGERWGEGNHSHAAQNTKGEVGGKGTAQRVGRGVCGNGAAHRRGGRVYRNGSTHDQEGGASVNGPEGLRGKRAAQEKRGKATVARPCKGRADMCAGRGARKEEGWDRAASCPHTIREEAFTSTGPSGGASQRGGGQGAQEGRGRAQQQGHQDRQKEEGKQPHGGWGRWSARRRRRGKTQTRAINCWGSWQN